jgi:AcrR family transcriptional regulator
VEHAVGKQRRQQALRLVDQTAVRAALTTDRIVRAAAELIESEGLAAVSMRRVATDLGVAPMSLYNHVPNKAALLDGVAEHLIAQLAYEDDPEGDWLARGLTLARAFRALAQDHPRGMAVALARQINSPAGLRLMEHALRIVADGGFTGQQAVRVVRTVVAYIIGSLSREGGHALMLTYADDPQGVLERADPVDYPHVRGLADLLVAYDFEDDFEFGLQLVFSGIAGLPRESCQHRPIGSS